MPPRRALSAFLHPLYRLLRTLLRPCRQFLRLISRLLGPFASPNLPPLFHHHHSLLPTLLGVFITLLLTALTSFLAYQRSPAYYPTGNPADSLTALSLIRIPTRTSATLALSLANEENHVQLENVLADSFGIPPSLSRKIPIDQRYSLLTKLQTAHHPRTRLPPRLFFLHIVGSDAAGRFHAIATALTYARNTERFLLILWDVDRGGNSFGLNPVRSLPAMERENMILTYVNGLHLTPNMTHWSEYQINYYTSFGSGGHPLDSLAALSTRHIFYRTEKSIYGRYAAILPGIMEMPNVLSPGIETQRAWYNVVKHWTFPHLDSNEVSDLLNRVYGVPLVFIEGMSDRSRRILLRSLDLSSSKRAFFVHAQYGLGNRLRALGSAMAVARVTGRVLVLIWEPDVHLDCRFSDLFVNEYVVIDKLNMNWPPGGTANKDHALRSVDFYNFMRFNGQHIHNPLKELVNPRNGRHVYVKTAYVVRSSFTPRIISTTSKYWKLMREELVPQAEIMMLVNDPSFSNIRNLVGVHIRARTIENDIKGVSEEFYGKGSRTTDHWRRLTGLKTFEAKIMRLSLKYKFFVAADTREAIRSLENKFGSHRIFSLPRDQDCVTRDVECAKLALADILLLAQVPTLLGSHWSSFTEGAVRLSGRVKVLLAGVHFGRQQSQSSTSSGTGTGTGARNGAGAEAARPEAGADAGAGAGTSKRLR